MAAALAPRMVTDVPLRPAAASWLQCGRGSRAADGCGGQFCPSAQNSLQCGRGSRAADGSGHVVINGALTVASMWPRLSRRGWQLIDASGRAGWQPLQCGRGSRAADGIATSSFSTPVRIELQCGRGSRAADGERSMKTRWRPTSGFNVAAALAPRMVWPKGGAPALGWVLQCGRGSRAADGVAESVAHRRCGPASMWPRLSRRGWRGAGSRRRPGPPRFNVAAALAPRMGPPRSSE